MVFLSLVFTYAKVLIFFGSLIASGVLIAKRTISSKRVELIIPAGAIFGIAIFIFLLNSISHFLKGPIAIYSTWIIQLFLSILVTKWKTKSLRYPKFHKVTWIFLSVVLLIFLYNISSTAQTDGADSTIHYSLASVFERGDYPIHTPWQPQYTAYYHVGGAQLLGAARTITSAPFNFLHPFVGFLALFATSQILIWILKPDKKSRFYLLILPPLVGLVSLGGFMLVWPSTFSSIQLTIKDWVANLPTLTQSFEVYGSPTSLDALMLFLHRFLALSFFFGITTLALYPSTKKNKLLTTVVAGVIFLSIALTDETIFLVTTPALLIILLYSLFNKSLKRLLVFALIIFSLAVVQGGIITETVFNSELQEPSVSLFPENQGFPFDKSENYRSYRLEQQKGKLFTNTQSPLMWYHPGILIQIGTLLVLFLLLRHKISNSKLKSLTILLLISCIVSLISFHGIVPKGYTHTNGNRFLALSYYLSGVGIIYLINYFLKRKDTSIILKTITIWILVFSLIPPLLKLYPRQEKNWFLVRQSTHRPTYKWVKDNLPFNSRVLALTDNTTIPVPNIELVRYAGVYTPVWGKTPRAHDSFDMSPIYADAFYTLDPQILEELEIQYLIIDQRYLDTLPNTRVRDIENPKYFEVLFVDKSGQKILKIKSNYFTDAKNYRGTFTELSKIAPKGSSYYIDYPPNIPEWIYRALRLALHDREIYYNPQGSFYNSRIDVRVAYYGRNKDKYDFLVLGEEVDPKSICECETKVFWQGFGNGVVVYKTFY